ncbi:hypothetical protein UFOVP531_12 [uncultured Caudovirales phage]|uniref:Uncharacterized protein n=1 Tax=uncultured Caudovirales phage TaxID=2100421 RepID=A0A6J5MN89_9CAUD|nr:hypothetical protein UFOVP531_12 [uncultured Caudovirales phage]
MENKVVNLEIKSNVDESIAGLKLLKRQLKDTAAGSDEFKKLYNQIDDLEDKIKSSKKASADWVDSLEQAGGPLGMLGAGINRAKVATQTFGGALKATGIGLIVSLLGGLVAAFSNNEGAMQKIQPLIDGLKKAFQGVFRAVEPLFDTFIDLATDALPYVSKGIGMVYSAMMAYFTFIKESGTGVMKILKGVFTLDADAITEGIDQVGGSFKKTQNSYSESMKRFSQGSKELTEKEKEELEKREDNRKAALEKQQENEKRAREKAAEEEQKRREKIAEDKKKFDEETQAGLELLRQANLNKDLEDSANKRGLLDEQIALLNEGVNAVQEAETKTTNIIKENSDAKIKLAEAEANARKALFAKTSETLSKGADLLGKNTAQGKAMAAAAALINTYQGISAELATKTVTPFEIGLKIANVAIIAATGFKSVQDILAVQVPNSGGGGGGSAPSAPAMAAPSFNVIGQGGANQIAQSIAGQEQQPLQAFVVANDVTTSQSLSRNIVNNASMG